jgi:hypothetical protein
LVVEYEVTNRRRELVTLPPAFESSCGLAIAFRRGSACGLDRVGGRAEFMRGNVCDGPGLAGGIRVYRARTRDSVCELRFCHQFRPLAIFVDHAARDTKSTDRGVE